MKKIIHPLIGLLTCITLAACMWILAKAARERAVLEGIATLDTPVFSVPGGFYSDAFYLEIESPDRYPVYYTTDGSTPTENSYLYEEPILIRNLAPISEAIDHWKVTGAAYPEQNVFVVRAIAVNAGGEHSDIAAATYFIDSAELADRFTVSIITDPGNIFGEKGIYTNYMDKGPEWEREINLELFEGDYYLNQPAGIRIQGASTREEYAKRFSVFSRKEYSGSKYFDQPVFGEYPTHSFVLRSGFMNAFIQHLVRDRDIASADAREAYVFLNGHFLWPTMIQEKYNSSFFETHYDFKKNNVIIIKAGLAESGDPSDQQAYQEIYDFLRSHDLSDIDCYNELNRFVDIQSYIDFSCVNVYFANLDYNEDKNVICWRSRKPGKSGCEDCRWRWALFDLDLENLDYGYLEEEINTFTLDTHYAGGAFNTREMYVRLKQSEQFCREFVLTLMDMINTDFTVENAGAVYDDWNVTLQYGMRTADWCRQYFPARNKKIVEYIREEFQLSAEPVSINLSTNLADAGTITLNTIQPRIDEGGWSGSYFPDYPITLSACAKEGYVFVEWQVNGKKYASEDTVEIAVSADASDIRAVFRKGK